jgi:CheY-like chemotaxis protein
MFGLVLPERHGSFQSASTDSRRQCVGSVCTTGENLLSEEGKKRVTPARPKREPKGGCTPLQPTHSSRRGQASSVVVVDDDPYVLRALSRLVRAAGFRVLAFDRPSALLASKLPRANACMLVDLNLPEMNGSDLCSLLAASGRDLPAILITGRNDYATRRLIAKEQFIEILFKPVDEQVLLDAIARALAYSYA